MASYSDFMDDLLSECPGVPYPLALDRMIRVVRDFCKRTNCWQADLTDVSIISGTQSYTIADPDADSEIVKLVMVNNSESPKVYYDKFTFDPPTLKLIDSPTTSWTMELRASLRPTKSATSYTIDSALDYTTTFTDSDLTAGCTAIYHGLNDQYVYTSVYNEDDQLVIPDSVTATDANTVTICLNGYGTITGTWHINVFSGSRTVTSSSITGAEAIDDIIYDNYYEGIIAGTATSLLRMQQVPWTNLELARIYNNEYNGQINKAIIDLNKQFTNRDVSVQMREWV